MCFAVKVDYWKACRWRGQIIIRYAEKEKWRHRFIIAKLDPASEGMYSMITLVLAISIFKFLFPWIDKSKIRPCGDFSNTLKKFAMKSFSLISSICVKSENFAMTQLPGGKYCHQVIY